jgi:hypothetical protein
MAGMSGRFFRCLGFFTFTLQIATKRGADERTRTAYPCSSYECAVIGCWTLQEFADSVFLRGFLFPGLPIIARYCVRVRVITRVKWCRKSMDCAPPVPSAAIECHVAKSVRLALEADLQGADYFNFSAADTAMERSIRGTRGSN